MDELTLLAEMRKGMPADARYPAAHRALLAEIAGAESAVPPRGRSVRRPVVASGLLAGAVAAGTVVVAVTPGSGNDHQAPRTVPASGYTALAPLRPGDVTSPMVLARNAVEMAQRTPLPATTQWVYVKTSSTISHAPPSEAMPQVPGSHQIQETWNRVDMLYVASIQDGKTVVTNTNGGMGNPIGWPRITYSYVNSLPTDPDALLAVIKQNIVSTHSYRILGGHGGAVFHSVLALMENVPALSPRLSAALYGVLARLDTVHLGHRTDNSGRRVLSLDHVEGGFRDSILINPATYAYAGRQRVVVQTSNSTALDGTIQLREGEVFADEAVLVSRIVNAPGARK